MDNNEYNELINKYISNNIKFNFSKFALISISPVSPETARCCLITEKSGVSSRIITGQLQNNFDPKLCVSFVE